MSTVHATDHRALMDQVYRRQRHVYDATRKFYLLGRDGLLDGLDPPKGGSVLEIGCGTGRNLLALAGRRPDLALHGLDISTEMLASAGAALVRAGLVSRIRLAQADASAIDPRATFQRPGGFDRVFFSYTLSMVPDWRAAVNRAVDALAPGGSLHVVDFGEQDGLPPLFRAGLRRWLAWFHVVPRSADFAAHLAALAEERGADFAARPLYRGYAWTARLTRPA